MPITHKVIVLTSVLLFSCNQNNSQAKFYKAISENKLDSATLKINYQENSFFGDYIIHYANNTKDSGNITGKIYGDTLKGKYRYIGRNGLHKIKPIVLLKDNNNLKLGDGTISTYMDIPFYANGSIQFKDSLFLFKEVN